MSLCLILMVLVIVGATYCVHMRIVECPFLPTLVALYDCLSVDTGVIIVIEQEVCCMNCIP